MPSSIFVFFFSGLCVLWWTRIGRCQMPSIYFITSLEMQWRNNNRWFKHVQRCCSMLMDKRVCFLFICFSFLILFCGGYSCTGWFKIDCRPIDGQWIKKVPGANGLHGRRVRGLAVAEFPLRCATAAHFVPGKLYHHTSSIEFHLWWSIARHYFLPNFVRLYERELKWPAQKQIESKV